MSFDEAMFDIYNRAKEEAGYNARRFLGYLHENGGVKTAKHLLNSNKISDGYAALLEKGRLDLTVEALIVENPIWHNLFTAEELAIAKDRLNQYGYYLAAP